MKHQERAGSYAQVLANPALYNNDVTQTRKDGRIKYGVALSCDDHHAGIDDVCGSGLSEEAPSYASQGLC